MSTRLDQPQPAKVAPAKRKIDALRLFAQAADALQVLDDYRALTDRESERVWNFLDDAKRRQRDPQKEAVYAVLETFGMFVRDYQDGETMEQICQWSDLTEVQYGRLVGIWETLQTVCAEVEELVRTKYGPQGEVL